MASQFTRNPSKQGRLRCLPAHQPCSTPSRTGSLPNQRAPCWIIWIGADGPPIRPFANLVEVRIVNVQDLHLKGHEYPGEARLDEPYVRGEARLVEQCVPGEARPDEQCGPGEARPD